MSTRSEKVLEEKVQAIDDELLLEKCENLVLKLCESPKAWEMSVPPFKYDSDIILMELIRRYRKAKQKELLIKTMQADEKDSLYQD